MIQHFFIDSTFPCRRHHFLVCSDEMMAGWLWHQVPPGGRLLLATRVEATAFVA
jgi:hypothetical protein